MNRPELLVRNDHFQHSDNDCSPPFNRQLSDIWTRTRCPEVALAFQGHLGYGDV